MRGEAPAWQRAAIRDSGLVEPIFENRFLVENHEQMECDGNEERVREDGHVTEEPNLAEEDGENSVVHGVTGIAIQPARNEVARWIDRSQRAFAASEEVPDAAKENGDSNKNQKTGRHGGRVEGGEA